MQSLIIELDEDDSKSMLSALVFTGLICISLSWLITAATIATAPIRGATQLLTNANQLGRRIRTYLTGTLLWACWLMPWVFHILYTRRDEELPTISLCAAYTLRFIIWIIGPIADISGSHRLGAAIRSISRSYIRSLVRLRRRRAVFAYWPEA